MKTNPLPETHQGWQREQQHLQTLLREKQDEAFMNAETELKIRAIRIQKPGRPLDVDERATPGSVPIARPTFTTDTIVGISEQERHTSGELPTVNFYVAPDTWHMQILHAIKMRIESYKRVYFGVPKVIRLSHRCYTVLKAMWTDCYYYDGHAIPLTDDSTLTKKLKDDEVECEHW